MRYKFLTLAALCILSSPTYALTPAQVFAKVKNSVVVVLVMDEKDEPIAFGSGVYLPSGKVATNCHVVESATSIKINHNDISYPATLYGGDIDRDICILSSPGLRATPATLGNAATLNVGDPMFAVGSPKGLELSLSDGIVSALRGGFPPTIQTTAAISKGSSGGGLFDAQGKLVGITTLYVDDGQNLNFAMPVEWIAQIKPISNSSVAAAPKAQTNSDNKFPEQANQLNNTENWSGLLALAKRWKAAEPENDRAWFAAAKAYEGMEKYELAIAEYAQAIKMDSTDAIYWHNFGRMLVYTENFDDALTAYNKAVTLDSTNSLSFYMIGVLENEHTNNYSKALSALQKAIAIEPEISSYWLEIGNTYQNLKMTAKAANAYEQALRLKPKNTEAMTALAYNKLGDKNYTQALTLSQSLLKIDQTKEDPWFIKGTAKMHMRDHQGAINDLLTAVKIKPEFSNAWFNLSLSYYANDQTVEAIQAYQVVKKLDPDSAPELYNIIKP